MITGSLCLTEILKSWKSCSSNSDASHSADSTSASGVALPYFAMIRGSSEPAFTPIRIEMPASLAAFAISPTWSSNFRMLPGLTRTAAQPASIAAKTYFGWKWMSAMTGICDFFAIAGSASASSWDGHRDADDVAAGGGELGDLLEGGVDVGGQGRRHRLHRDRVRRRRPRPCRPRSDGSSGAGRARRGCLRHAEIDRHGPSLLQRHPRAAVSRRETRHRPRSPQRRQRCRPRFSLMGLTMSATITSPP